MNCSNCGLEASGNFCANCGAALVSDLVQSSSSGWEATPFFNVLIKNSEVRNLLAFFTAQSRKKMTGMEILRHYDRILRPMTGGVPLQVIATLVVPVYAKMGIKTGKSLTFSLPSPIGKTIVAALCYFARQGWAVDHVEQGADGCLIEATVPSDFLAWEGTMIAGISGDAETTNLDAGITIRGQLYDWGKSKRALQQFQTQILAISKQIS